MRLGHKSEHWQFIAQGYLVAEFSVWDFKCHLLDSFVIWFHLFDIGGDSRHQHWQQSIKRVPVLRVEQLGLGIFLAFRLGRFLKAEFGDFLTLAEQDLINFVHLSESRFNTF